MPQNHRVQSVIFNTFALSAMLLASPAIAVTYTCASVDGVVFSAGPAGNADIMIDLASGETLTLMTSSATLGAEFNDSAGGNKLNCADFPGSAACADIMYTAQSDDVHQLEAFNNVGSTFTLSCSAGAGTTTALAGPNFGVIAGKTSQASANAQSSAVGTAVSSVAVARLQGTSGGLGVTASTRGGGSLGDDWNIWANATARRFTGTLDGQGGELTFGFDRNFGSVVAGAIISANRLDGAVGVVNSDATSYAIGPYFAASLGGNYVLDGYLTYGKASYDVGAASFEARRTMAGLNIRNQYRLGNINVTPFGG
ncbi:MAG: hypothetical protein WBC85_11600, partial [Planktotalea sp.]|uniref:hypothetical protein n=1 Tax=Planktotalea sp. TaxID=2029877 RepID=UPI003C764D9F